MTGCPSAAFSQGSAPRAALTPAMITLDTRVIRQDCLCYLMERLDPAAYAHPDA